MKKEETVWKKNKKKLSYAFGFLANPPKKGLVREIGRGTYVAIAHVKFMSGLDKIIKITRNEEEGMHDIAFLESRAVKDLLWEHEAW